MPALDAPFTSLHFIYLLVKVMWGEVPPSSSQLSALMRGCELTSARVTLQPQVSGQCWGPTRACAHHESPTESPWPSCPAAPHALLAAQPHIPSLALQDCPGREPGQNGPCVWHPPCLEPCLLEQAQDWLQSPHGGENTAEGRASREGPWQGEGFQAGNQEHSATEHPAVPHLRPSCSTRCSACPGTPNSNSPGAFLSHLWSHCRASRQNARRGGHACRMPVRHRSPLFLLPPPKSQLLRAPWGTFAQVPGPGLLRTPLGQELQWALPRSSPAGTRHEESPISWTNKATAQLSGTPKTQPSREG